MARVRVNWTANPLEELVSSYNVYSDGALLGSVAAPPYDADMAPAVHSVEVAAVNVWGEGPKSDPVLTPPAASKPGGVSVSISVNVNIG